MVSVNRGSGRRVRWLAASAGAAFLLAVGGAVALGTIPGSGGVITGCYMKTTGLLRVIDASSQTCKDSETQITWNQQGPQGLQGPAGPQGLQGPAGPAGPIGPAGVSGYEVVDTATAGPFDPFGLLQITAYCSAGKKPLGGGYFVDPPGVIEVVSSSPFLSAVGNGWHIVAANTTNNATGQLIAYAVCATVG